MKKKRIKGMHPDHVAEYRNHCWYHNSLLGRLRSSKNAMHTIANARSCNSQAHELANQISLLMNELEDKMKDRVDPGFIELYRIGS